jgi:hypothetical protein
MPLKKQMYPKSKVKVNMLTLSDKVKILDLSKDCMSSAEAEWHHGKNESSFCNIFLNSMYPEHSESCFSLTEVSLEP